MHLYDIKYIKLLKKKKEVSMFEESLCINLYGMLFLHVNNAGF